MFGRSVTFVHIGSFNLMLKVQFIKIVDESLH